MVHQQETKESTKFYSECSIKSVCERQRERVGEGRKNRGERRERERLRERGEEWRREKWIENGLELVLFVNA